MSDDEGIIAPPGGQPMPHNEVTVKGTASSAGGAEIHGSIEREKTTAHGDISGGVQAGISQKQGWSVGGFFKWVFK